jgi:hypothetical protein
MTKDEQLENDDDEEPVKPKYHDDKELTKTIRRNANGKRTAMPRQTNIREQPT